MNAPASVSASPLASGAGAQGPADALRALSRSLLTLSQHAQEVQPQDLLPHAMQTLRDLVPFDSAWWGEVSAGDVQSRPHNWLHGSMGLSQSFAQEWNALSAVDEFGRRSMERLGVVVRERDVMDGSVEEHPAVAAFSQRHGLYHCMALTAELPHSGLMFFVSVYRPQMRSEFTDEETALFGEFVVHLLQHWHHVLQRLQSESAGRPGDSFALVDLSGELLFAGLRISMALGEACPGWAGTRLPPELVLALPRAPCSLVVGTAPGKSCRLRLEPCGSLVAVSMASRHARSPLAPRELSAAMLYAQGHSHKDIAAALGLTPATVRTYLRTAYAVLGVSNKLALLAALRNG